MGKWKDMNGGRYWKVLEFSVRYKKNKKSNKTNCCMGLMTLSVMLA